MSGAARSSMSAAWRPHSSDHSPYRTLPPASVRPAAASVFSAPSARSCEATNRVGPVMCPIFVRPELSRCLVASSPPCRSSGTSDKSAGLVDWVIAYTTGTETPAPIGSRGSCRRPVTMMPSTRRSSRMRR